MGLVICKHHGRSGIVLACSHLSESAWNYKPINCFVKRVETDMDEIDSFTFNWIYYLCESCDKQNEQTSFDKLPEHLPAIFLRKMFYGIIKFRKLKLIKNGTSKNRNYWRQRFIPDAGIDGR
jgi:hypothetical protein